MRNFKSKRVLVTGGNGFLGNQVCNRLMDLEYKNIYAPRRAEYDLTKESSVERLYSDIRPDIVIHLAAKVGGIGANRANPGLFFYENLIMGALLLEYARRSGVEKFVTAGTICSYPKFTPVPFKEEDLWNGYPEETNAPYGIAKKALLVQSQTYREQYGLNAIYLLPVNLYGPGDNFDSETSHVIPALIRKCLEAKATESTEIVCWGDGSPTREFLYVEDCAEAIVMAMETFNGSYPINIGTGKEISIAELASLICELTNFKGRITWDLTKPNGQPRRCLDTSKAREALGFSPRTSLKDGLKKTIEWYINK